ncbi:MAG: hypothetical protein HC880_18730 [Bacteroidia bacterium]|nr:hypothetical protein [Bacteroidia bacterium]
MSGEKIKYYQDTFLNQMRQEGDPVADQVIKAVFEAGEAPALGWLMASLQTNTSGIPG